MRINPFHISILNNNNTIHHLASSMNSSLGLKLSVWLSVLYHLMVTILLMLVYHNSIVGSSTSIGDSSNGIDNKMMMMMTLTIGIRIMIMATLTMIMTRSAITITMIMMMKMIISMIMLMMVAMTILDGNDDDGEMPNESVMNKMSLIQISKWIDIKYNGPTTHICLNKSVYKQGVTQWLLQYIAIEYTNDFTVLVVAIHLGFMVCFSHILQGCTAEWYMYLESRTLKGMCKIDRGLTIKNATKGKQKCAYFYECTVIGTGHPECTWMEVVKPQWIGNVVILTKFS